MNAHALHEFASGFYAFGFVFSCAVAIEADGEAYPRLFNHLLLLLILEKFRYVSVLFEGMQAVIIDIQLPENLMFCHLLQETIGVFTDGLDKPE